jgi:hypothetical protein
MINTKDLTTVVAATLREQDIVIQKGNIRCWLRIMVFIPSILQAVLLLLLLLK